MSIYDKLHYLKVGRKFRLQTSKDQISGFKIPFVRFNSFKNACNTLT